MVGDEMSVICELFYAGFYKLYGFEFSESYIDELSVRLAEYLQGLTYCEESFTIIQNEYFV